MKNYSVLLPVSPTYNDKTIFILVYNKLKIVEGYQSDTLLPITSGSPCGGTTPFLVGWTRFELATPRPPDVCATGLRHHPKTLKSNLYQSFFHRAANIGLKEIFKLYL